MDIAGNTPTYKAFSGWGGYRGEMMEGKHKYFKNHMLLVLTSNSIFQRQTQCKSKGQSF